MTSLEHNQQQSWWPIVNHQAESALGLQREVVMLGAKGCEDIRCHKTTGLKQHPEANLCTAPAEKKELPGRKVHSLSTKRLEKRHCHSWLCSQLVSILSLDLLLRGGTLLTRDLHRIDQLGRVAHTCNTGYSGGFGSRDERLKS